MLALVDHITIHPEWEPHHDPLWIAWSQVLPFSDFSTWRQGRALALQSISILSRACLTCLFSFLFLAIFFILFLQASLRPVLVESRDWVSMCSYGSHVSVVSEISVFTKHPTCHLQCYTEGGEGIILRFLLLFWSHVSLWCCDVIGSTYYPHTLHVSCKKLCFGLVS